MKLLNLLVEGLSEYQKKYVDQKLYGSEYNPNESHPEMFNDMQSSSNPNHIIIPIKLNADNFNKNLIDIHLKQHGWDIKDYQNGLAHKYITDINGNKKEVVKNIGKILHQNGATNLLDNYQKDDFRANVDKEYNIIISRDKHDIAGMSTDRKWQSCMTLPKDRYDDGGEHHNHIKDDLKHHTLAAYVVNKGDDDIESPLARVLIKKHVNENGNVTYRPLPDSVYGKINTNNSVYSTLNGILSKYYPLENNTSYELHPYLYNDNRNGMILHGLHHSGGVARHYNENGLLHDYIDENGVNQPAYKGDDMIAHYNNGVFHSEGDYPTVISNNVDEWYKNGVLHRDGDKPAVIIHEPHFKSESYYKYGLEHNDKDRPSTVGYHIINGFHKLANSEWKHLGLSHRDGDKPSEIKYGKISGKYIAHSKMGLSYNPKGKPSVEYENFNDGDGIVNGFQYYTKGMLHNPNDTTPSYYQKTENENGYHEMTKHRKNGIPYSIDGKPTDVSVTVKHGNKEIRESYLDKNGNNHNEENKPAKIITSVNKEGTTVIEHYLKHGVPIYPIRMISHRHFDDGRIHSSYRYNSNKDGIMSKSVTKDGNGNSHEEVSYNNRPDKLYYSNNVNGVEQLKYQNHNGLIEVKKQGDAIIHKIYKTDSGLRIKTNGDSVLLNDFQKLTKIKDGIEYDDGIDNIKITNGDFYKDGKKLNEKEKSKYKMDFLDSVLNKNKIGMDAEHLDIIKKYVDSFDKK